MAMNVVLKTLLSAAIKIGITWLTLELIRKKIEKELGFDPAKVLKQAIKMATDPEAAMKEMFGNTPEEPKEQPQVVAEGQVA